MELNHRGQQCMLVQYHLNNIPLTSLIAYWHVNRILEFGEKRQLMFSIVNLVSRLHILFPTQSQQPVQDDYLSILHVLFPWTACVFSVSLCVSDLFINCFQHVLFHVNIFCGAASISAPFNCEEIDLVSFVLSHMSCHVL